MALRACVFDAYGTLFDLFSPARTALLERNRKSGANLAQAIANDWRMKQLQYTWIRAITGCHADFWTVTCESLDWALEKSNLQNDTELRSELLELYKTLNVYPEVPTVLDQLQALDCPVAILSNGSPEMLATAADASGISTSLDAIMSVEDVGIYKPATEVYEMVTTRYDCRPKEILFVSSNGWDAAAASGFGFLTAWINRANDPVDRLPWKPEFILPNLTKIPNLAKKL